MPWTAPTYHIATTQMSKKAISSIPSFCQSSDGDKGGLHPLAWDKISHPIQDGGLGLTKMELKNEALLAKHFWRVIHRQTS